MRKRLTAVFSKPAARLAATGAFLPKHIIISGLFNDFSIYMICVFLAQYMPTLYSRCSQTCGNTKRSRGIVVLSV